MQRNNFVLVIGLCALCLAVGEQVIAKRGDEPGSPVVVTNIDQHAIPVRNPQNGPLYVGIVGQSKTLEVGITGQSAPLNVHIQSPSPLPVKCVIQAEVRHLDSDTDNIPYQFSQMPRVGDYVRCTGLPKGDHDPRGFARKVTRVVLDQGGIYVVVDPASEIPLSKL